MSQALFQTIFRPIADSAQSLSYSLTALTSTSAPGNATAVGMTCTTLCHVRIGGAPGGGVANTATQNDLVIPITTLHYFPIQPGQTVSVRPVAAGVGLLRLTFFC